MLTIETWQLILFQVVLLVVCEYGPFSPFVARKGVHTFSGLMMLQLDPTDWVARWFVYAVVVSSLAMVWDVAPVKFRYAKPHDVGITVYLLIVGIFFYTQLSLSIIRPVFFADPCGAIVGKYLSAKRGVWNPCWIGEKTVGGTAAVFVVAFLTLSFGTQLQKLLLSALVAFVEGVSKEYDNLLIALVVLTGYAILS